MSFIHQAAVTQAVNLHPGFGNRPLMRALSRGLLRLSRLLALGRYSCPRDEPGVAVLHDLGLKNPRVSSAFDFVDIHHGIESSRLHLRDTLYQSWRGS
jgi:hypothetical protein